MNFVATPFGGERLFSDATQANTCHKFCCTSIFGKKVFFLILHKQKFEINFEATPFVGKSVFLMLNKQKFALFGTQFLRDNLGYLFIVHNGKLGFRGSCWTLTNPLTDRIYFCTFLVNFASLWEEELFSLPR